MSRVQCQAEIMAQPVTCMRLVRAYASGSGSLSAEPGESHPARPFDRCVKRLVWKTPIREMQQLDRVGIYGESSGAGRSGSRHLRQKYSAIPRVIRLCRIPETLWIAQPQT